MLAKTSKRSYTRPRRLVVTSFDEFIYLPTARVLMKFSKLKHVMGDKGGWPPPVPPMRLKYIVNPSLLDSPKMWKYEEEDKLLSQLLIDIALVDEARGHLGELSKDDHRIRDAFAVDDVLSTHMRKLWTMENITVTSVFAARYVISAVEERPASEWQPSLRRLCDVGGAS